MSLSTQERLDNYLAAEAAVLKHQAFQVAGRSLTFADLGEIRQAIAQLKRELAIEQAGSKPARGSLRFKTVVFD